MEYTYKIIDDEIILRSDGASIPMDEGNRDYRAYLEWVNEGGEVEIVTTPKPSVQPTVEERLQAAEQTILELMMLQ